MNTDKFTEKCNNFIDLEDELINNADNFIKHIIENSNEILDLSELGIITLNLYTHNDLLKKIIKINISKNLLKEILFIPNNIVYLDISFNNFKNIDFVKKLVNLKYLNISYNKNVFIEDDIFMNLVNLQSVEMAGNNLKSIFNMLFINLEQLEYLNLAGNKLVSIKDIIFPKKIKLLNITYNNIQKEEHDDIKKNSNIIF